MTTKNFVVKNGITTGNITLDATGKLALNSKQDVAVEGLNITNTAKVGFTAKGNASAEISASGQTIVKGAINKNYPNKITLREITIIKSATFKFL